MVHTLKVVYSSETGEKEIRRLTVHDDVINQYCLLAEKIVKLFPQLNGQCFQLGWRDSEGDYIVMSSDEELAQAVANAVENGVIKVFVTRKTATNTDNKARSSVVHPNVVCDACNGSVYGYRYKCMECVDYDLCESCNAKDKHPGHDMMKLCTPIGPTPGFTSSNYHRVCNAIVDHYTSKLRSSSERKAGSAFEFIPRNRNNATASSRNSEFLKNIGKSVAFMLDPLGIDVDVSVSESDVDSPPECKKEAQAETEVKEKEAKNTTEEKTEEEPKNMTEGKTELGKISEAQAAAASLDVTKEKTAKSSSSPVEGSSESSGEGALPKNYGLFARPESSSNEKVDLKDSRESSPENLNGHDDWTVVNDFPNLKEDKNGVARDTATTVADLKVSYPTLPEEKAPSDASTQQTALLDPKIAHALCKMCAMGFTNEGGWLTRLLETKNGNINDVLDALYPNHH